MKQWQYAVAVCSGSETVAVCSSSNSDTVVERGDDLEGFINYNKMAFRSLLAHKKGFELAMEIFEISKSFPKEEKYSLTDQVRRSSRSVCANIAESYRKRRYPKHFISKLSDADAENSETLGWLDFAEACKYISKEVKDKLEAKNIEIGKLINYMINNPDKFR